MLSYAVDKRCRPFEVGDVAAQRVAAEKGQYCRDYFDRRVQQFDAAAGEPCRKSRVEQQRQAVARRRRAE